MFGYPSQCHENQRVERLNELSSSMDADEVPGAMPRGGAMFSGLFLFFFGLPFTCVPLLMFYGVESSFDSESIFMCMFSIPFLLAGLFVQMLGIRAIYSGITGKGMLLVNEDDEEETHRSTREISVSYPSYDELQRQIHNDSNAPAQTPATENEGEPEAEEPGTGAFWSLSDRDETQD